MNAPPEVSAAYIACTDKQRALALNLAKGMFKSDAMRAAGYSEGQSRKCHKDVVDHPNVVTLSQWYASQAIKKNEVTVERVLKELARLAFFDVAKLVGEDGRPLPISQIDEDTRRAVVGLDVATVGNAQQGMGEVLKLKMADKGANLERLGRHLKMFVDKVELSGSVALADAIMAARGRAKR